jgi:class 3 adenylate cyclase
MSEEGKHQEFGDLTPADASAETLFLDRVLMFTDIEGSTTRWDAEPDTMGALMRHHDSLVATVVERHGGVLGARTGDGAIALFVTSTEALQAALEFRELLVDGPKICSLHAAPLSIRVGLHRGVVEPRDGEYYGPPMHRTARIMSTGHGGQIVASELVANELALAFGNKPSSGHASIPTNVDDAGKPGKVQADLALRGRTPVEGFPRARAPYRSSSRQHCSRPSRPPGNGCWFVAAH